MFVSRRQRKGCSSVTKHLSQIASPLGDIVRFTGFVVFRQKQKTLKYHKKSKRIRWVDSAKPNILEERCVSITIQRIEIKFMQAYNLHHPCNLELTQSRSRPSGLSAPLQPQCPSNCSFLQARATATTTPAADIA